MSTSISNRKASVLLAIVLLVVSASLAGAQTTEFTYQGKLSEGGTPANGSYDFEFLLYDALAAGTAQGLPVQRLNVTVTSGIFTVQLDFGNQFNGANRFLDISVRASGGGLFTVLSPRQQVTSNPYAIKSLNSSTADGLSIACANCVTSSQIQSVQGSKVTGEIPVASIPAGSNHYIGNNSGLQAADIDISGSMTANGFDSNLGYSIGGGAVLTTPGTNNLFLGLGSGASTTAGGNNVFIGTGTGPANTTGNFNSFFGRGAGLANTTGSNNTVVGSNANFGSGNLSFATAIGANAFVSTSNTILLGRSLGQDTVQVPGILNVANQINIGGGRVLSIAGSDNLFVGQSTGAANTTGNSNAFFGRSAGVANTTASSNSFFGTVAGASTTTGGNNSFFGRSAGQSNTTGVDNSFFGSSAGASNTSGDDNAFFGRAAGVSNTTGASNSFFGRSAGNTNSTGVNNSFFGRSAGSANTTGGSNAFFGWSTGDSNTTGANNAFFGAAAGSANTNGTNNTFIGTNAGLSNTTGGSNTYIGINAGGSPGISNAAAIGANAFANLSNQIVLGTNSSFVLVPGSFSVSSIRLSLLAPGGNTAVCRNALNDLATCSSSLRYKTNIAPFSSGLSLVNRLRPITFDWKEGGMHDLGLGAEDVAAIEPLLVTYNKAGQVEGVKYDRIGVVLLNAVKEQQQIITAQQQRVEQQEERFKQQEQRLEAQQREIEALKNQFFASRRAPSRRSRRK